MGTEGATSGDVLIYLPECDGTKNFFRYRDQFFPVPGPVLFSGTNFFRYRDRYFFPGPIFSGTGTGTSKKEQNSRDREFPGPGCHTLVSDVGNLTKLRLGTGILHFSVF